MNDKLLGKCSKCVRPLYQDQDGIVFPTINAGGSWYFSSPNQWDYFNQYWQHQCNPNNLKDKGYLIEKRNKIYGKFI